MTASSITGGKVMDGKTKRCANHASLIAAMEGDQAARLADRSALPSGAMRGIDDGPTNL